MDSLLALAVLFHAVYVIPGDACCGIVTDFPKGPATLLIDFAIMGVMIFNVGKHLHCKLLPKSKNPDSRLSLRSW